MAAPSDPAGLKIGVCLDGGECSIWAFHLALLRMNKHTDSLNLIYVAKAAGLEQTVGFGFIDLWKEMLEEDLVHGKALLRDYGHEAKRAGVNNLHLFLMSSTDIAGKIVDFSNDRGLHHLYLGRRSIPSTLERWLLGSVSKAVMEGIECNITIVSSRFGPEEQHSSLLGVRAAEEEERKRRIATERDEHLKALQAKLNEQIIVQLEDEEHLILE